MTTATSTVTSTAAGMIKRMRATRLLAIATLLAMLMTAMAPTASANADAIDSGDTVTIYRGTNSFIAQMDYGSSIAPGFGNPCGSQRISSEGGDGRSFTVFFLDNPNNATCGNSIAVGVPFSFRVAGLSAHLNGFDQPTITPLPAGTTVSGLTATGVSAGSLSVSGFTNDSFSLYMDPAVIVPNGTFVAYRITLPPLVVDSDGDGVDDDVDNCVNDANADQANNDGDAAGDVCDPDDDNDGVDDADDKYPFDPTRSENSAPVVDSINLPAEPIDIGNQPVAGISATFSDDDAIDTHTCTVDFGDGSAPVAGTVSGTTCSAPGHSYAEAGVFEVTVTISDNDGGTVTQTASSYVVIYDPSGGFVTGGGWLQSPAGAYVDDPTATGRASFGFVSKYKKGANVPSGQTEFQFKAGDLNFHSSSYDWLVIAGQDRAKFKGEGTINGAGNYGFMITAVDNGNGGDTFRIKIWDMDAGNGVVYDNQLGVGDDGFDGTSISGGNIKVHAR